MMDKYEQLFAKAEISGLIEQNKVSKQLSPVLAAKSLRMMREYDITQYCIEFRNYLNESEVSFETDKDFAAYCEQESTSDTFVKFLNYRKAETKKNIAEQAEKITKYTPNEQLHIAMDILGLTTGENNFNPVQPVFYYIDEVLIKHNLTPIQAAILLEAHTGGLSPLTNKSLTKKVIKHLKKLNKYGNQTPPQQAETKTDKLKAELITYGFLELSMVKQLSELSKQSLVELMIKNGLPYSIAMIEYLGFLKHLKAEHFKTDNKLFKAVADWLKVAERAVKGNIYVLNKNSKENKERYTADQHRQIVKNDYEKLK